MEARRGLLIILSGPSGVGKGTIRKKVMEDKSLNLAFSISCTTRLPRPLERDGVDYYFVKKDYFEKLIREDELLEWAEFVGHYYGTPRGPVEKMREEGKNVILEIEVEGAKQVMAKCRGNDVISIFIMPPSLEALVERIHSRKNERRTNIEERLAKATREMGLKYNYQYVVLNDDVDRAAEEVKNIIRDKLNATIES